MAASPRVRRLKWLCRRGMKELDVLLERFVAEESAALESGAWPEFENLLDLEDDQLWDFVQSPRSPGAVPYQLLLERICHGPALRD